MKKYLLFCAAMIAVSGCTLEEVIDRGETCPRDRNGVLSYIQSQDCTAESCNLEGDFSENFQYNVCPKDFPACATDNEGLYYCSKLACADNQHMYKGGCEDDSDERCNSHDINCNNQTGWLSGKCENKKCVALQCNDDQGYELNDGKCEARTSCDEGFHFYAGKCEEDTLFNCGSHGKDCMKKIPGWLEGECTNGECVALDCEEDYNLKNGQCQPLTICGTGEHLYAGHCDLDDLENCGSHGKNCAKKIPGWVNGECREGECVPTECEEIYEISDGYCIPRQSCEDKDTHLYNNICQPNDLDNCGSHGNKCSVIIEGWENGLCTESTCLPTSCKIGYHIDGIQCVRDSTNACGSIDIRCDDGQLCTQGECKDNCDTGEVRCTDKDGAVSCENPSTSQKFCGAQNACADYKTCTAYETCIDGTCVLTSCENQTLTFCTVADGGQCIDIHADDSKHCGSCDTDCSAKRPPNTISDACVKGQCIFYCAPEYENCGSETTPECHLKSSFNGDSLNCGGCGHSCGEDEYCRNGTCAKSSCAKTNECVVDGECKNTDTKCGVGCFDCTSKDNASDGKCVDGACVITKCAQNFHFKDGQCVPNTKTECAPMDSDKVVNCQTNSNAVDGYCGTDGRCVATECKENYHLKDGKCEENSITACGKSTSVVNCTELPGWFDGECKNSVCIATKCKHDYCIYNGTCTNGVSEMSTCGVQASTEGSLECVACNPSNQACVNGACKMTDCGSVCFYKGETCDNQDTHCGPSCTDCTKSSELHYIDGSCVKDTGSCKITKCESGYHLSGNMCIPDSLYNCGKNDYACQDNVAQWASGTCEGGVCKVSQCKAGYHVYDNKCEADSTTNCGAHGKTCNVSNASNSCKSSNCSYTCNANYHNYNNGCEINSVDNCGAHGAQCKTEGVQTATCSTDGKCSITACATGYHKYGTICEKDDNTNCGAHGTKCIVANANNTCSGGKCSFTCDSGYHKYGSTCEKTDIENCGTHGNACNVANADNTCSSNQCSFTCKSGYHKYNNACEADSTTNCGSHGNACNKSGANNSCTGGKCTFACQTNYHAYGTDCEADSTTNCGSHGNACNVANANNTCSSGKCSFSCNSGYHLYNNACEADSATNCGSHGNACNVANANNTCSGGKCSFSCNSGYHTYGSGCEADSVTNCGSHGNACNATNATNACSGGKCSFTCASTAHKYNNSCEANDTTNCGSHGNSCAVANASNRCDGTTCSFTCNAGFHKYGNTCEKDDLNNCGSHGNACAATNALTNTCNSGTCSFTCSSTYHKNGNACERDDAANCGSHGYACNTTAGEQCLSKTCKCVDGLFSTTVDGVSVKARCITTADDFEAMKKNVNAGINNTDVYILTRDITLPTDSSWTPVGNTSTYAFKGKFISNGKKLTASSLTCSSTVKECGLFGYAINATFRDFSLNVKLSGGTSLAGALAGQVANTTVTNVQLSGSVTSSATNVGGFFGNMGSAKLIDSSSSANVTSNATTSNAAVGGLSGATGGSEILNSSSTGTVTAAKAAIAGGLVGNLTGGTPINSSFFNGNVSSQTIAGGIAGTTGSGSRINDSYAAGTVTAPKLCGGISGTIMGAPLFVTNSAAFNTVTCELAAGLVADDPSKIYTVTGNVTANTINGSLAQTGLLAEVSSSIPSSYLMQCNVVSSHFAGSGTKSAIIASASASTTKVTDNMKPNFVWNSISSSTYAGYVESSNVFTYNSSNAANIGGTTLVTKINGFSACAAQKWVTRTCTIATGPAINKPVAYVIPLPGTIRLPAFCK